MLSPLKKIQIYSLFLPSFTSQQAYVASTRCLGTINPTQEQMYNENELLNVCQAQQ